VSAILTGIVVLVLFTAAGAEAPGPDVEMFTRAGCPHCAAALAFLEELGRRRPGLRIEVRDVQEDPRALERLVALGKRHGVEQLGVPAFHVRGRLVIGFGGSETTGAELTALLDTPVSGARGQPPGRAVGAGETVQVPFVGRVSVRDLGLPAFTVVLGLLDGFNPCAMWVLLFVLSLLVNLHDRVKMAVIGGTFVLVSGIVYFAFMAAWLNLFLLAGVSRAIEALLGLIAGVVGALNVKDFVAAGRGPSLAIPASAKPGIYARVRAVVTAERPGAALGGVIVLAVLVKVVVMM
jgi:glutaredoxin